MIRSGKIKRAPMRGRLPRRAGPLALGIILALALPALGQKISPTVPPRQPPPPPEQVYPGAVDRALVPPDVLRDDRVNPDSGVQIGLGPHSVALHFPKLKLRDKPNLDLAEGVVISGDVLFGNVRVGYSRQFYRRVLPAGSTLGNRPVNFLSVDGDEILATLGWRPWYGLYLGAIGGAEYRLIRVKQDTANVVTQTETTGLVGVMADLQIAVPFSLQARLLRESAERLVRLDSTILQLSYLIPF